MILFIRTTILSIIFSSLAYSANKIFNATEEWQLVPDDVDLPAGLHIRMDLKEGGKWAKLLDENEDNETAKTTNQEMVITKRDQARIRDYDFNKSKLNAELALLTNTDTNNLDPENDEKYFQNNENSKNSKSSEKSKNLEKQLNFEKLKNHIHNFSDLVISDFEKMKILVETLENVEENKIETDFYETTCEKLDYILSKVDNAHDAAKHGLLSRLVNLYETTPSRGIWRIFSASAQNNFPVANALFPVLKPVLERNIANLEIDSPLLKSAVFCLSAVVRALPVKDQLQIDWKLLLNSQNKHNSYLCKLVAELEIPYTCSKSKNVEL